MLQRILILGAIAVGYGYQWDRFDILDGYTFDSATAYSYKEVKSMGECVMFCSQHVHCFAFGLENAFGVWKCAKFTKIAKLKIKPVAVGFIGGPHIVGASLQKDFQYYFMSSTQAAGFEQAKTICQKTPEFRLALIKTEASKEIAFQFIPQAPNHYPYMVIDLKKNPDGTVEYGDGTSYSDVALGYKFPSVVAINDPAEKNIFVYTRENFHDESPNQAFRPLCQGDILKLHY